RRQVPRSVPHTSSTPTRRSSDLARLSRQSGQTPIHRGIGLPHFGQRSRFRRRRAFAIQRSSPSAASSAGLRRRGGGGSATSARTDRKSARLKFSHDQIASSVCLL